MPVSVILNLRGGNGPLYEVSRGTCVAQPGAGAEAEDGCEVQRVGPAGEGFLDDAVAVKALAVLAPASAT